MTTKRHKVSKLRLTEVSLVKDGMNDAARVNIVKMRSDDDGNGDDPVQNADLTEQLNAALAQVGLLKATITENHMDYREIKEQLDTATAAIENLTKAKADADAEIAKLKAENATLVEKAKQAEDPAAAEAEMLKSLPAPLRARLEKAAEAQKQVEDMKKALDERDAIEKARNDGLPDPDKLGPVLARLQKALSAEDVAVVMGAVKSAAAIVKASSKGDLFKAKGDGGNGGAGKSASDELKERAEEMRKGHPAMTLAQAQSAVIKGDPSLYRRYIEESRA